MEVKNHFQTRAINHLFHSLCGVVRCNYNTLKGIEVLKRKKFTHITKAMAKKGMKLKTWADSKGLDNADYLILLDISKGKVKGKRGRAKELVELLKRDGFKAA